MARRWTAAALTATLFACGGGPAATEPVVVAAFYPLAEAVERVGGSDLRVENLTPPGAEPHDLELRPSDVERLRAAALVLYVADFQPALDDALKISRIRDRALDVMRFVPAADRRSDDPHVWLDPVLMRRIVEGIRDALVAAFPARADVMRRRAVPYVRSIAALDPAYRSLLDECRRREMFTSHAAFGYLGERYGLREIAIAGTSPEAEPSPGRLQAVIERARRAKATTIFAETLAGTRAARTVARAAGARVAVLNPIEGLTEEQRRARLDYAGLMIQNARALQEALGCS